DEVLHGCPPLEIEELILSAPRRAAASLPLVEKVGEVDQWRNVPSGADRFLNLPVRSSIANESILRVSATKRLLQHYLPITDIGLRQATASDRSMSVLASPRRTDHDDPAACTCLDEKSVRSRSHDNHRC